ncbi:MAG: 16S rRNA (adenine(1518)-N(6)/adenine(1519)-N(6))-dimethyltransferase RsmA [Treponema sp.]|nr:16S rRNA (adenine(1518)-N(6)/adenine(1519)-N(6))-dimethyltransferase RsmA [Treponema sp.]
MNPLINYNSARELRAFLEERGLGMRKKFGQNFLINPSTRSMLFDELDLEAGEGVWEIGPGLGAMTAGLLEREGRVTAFEIDPAFCRILREFFSSNDGFQLIEGDVLKTWPMLGDSGSELLLGNLPYNIAATVLADFIEKSRYFKRIVVTVQSEVARRMAGRPGTKDYSSFSVLCSSVYKVTLLAIIKGSSFYPAPNVESRAVRLDLLRDSDPPDSFFYKTVRALFSGRRKKIKNTLSAYTSSLIMGEKQAAAQQAAMGALDACGISGDRRAETLEREEFLALSASLKEIVLNES